jgi:hypothetical protein
LERIGSWIKIDADARLLDALLDKGLSRILREAPARFSQQVEDWLQEEDDSLQQLGLRALVLLVEVDIHLLPVFYRLLAPFIRSVPAKLRPELLDVLQELARRSPKETAYFLRQGLDTSNNPDTSWLVRQCLSEFPPEIQSSLRAAARSGAG